jgi:hypothetical protein
MFRKKNDKQQPDGNPNQTNNDIVGEKINWNNEVYVFFSIRTKIRK